MPTPHPVLDRPTGFLLLATTLSVIGVEWAGSSLAGHAAAISAGLLIVLFFLAIDRSRRIFVLVGLALLAAAIATQPDWLASTEKALGSAAFIGGFFAALTFLRNASESSESIGECGRFLAEQPPGRRYAALTLGGHLFGLPLSYGAISLLGGLAVSSAKTEPDEEIRRHRVRRMLLAVQRGFVSTLPWSPLAFSMAISTSIIPGASWAGAVAPCLVTALILAGLGWALDTIFKPRLSHPAPPRRKAEGSWAKLWPLLTLLLVLTLAVGGLHVATGIRAAAVAIPVVPVVSILWIMAQNSDRDPLGAAGRRGFGYLSRELPAYRNEIALLMMAGFIGSLGSKLLAPVFAASGLHPELLPAWAILLALVWLIPATGQLGMNPILTISLFGPLLPTPAEMGVSPSAVITAITAGWALAGASSPFTATTLISGSLGGVSAVYFGLRWNGLYSAICLVLLPAWVLTYAFL